jgi:hypothetical protein
VRVFFAAIVALALGGVANAEIYNIQVWPDDLDKVPCEAWKKNADGSVTQTGTIVVAKPQRHYRKYLHRRGDGSRGRKEVRR